MTYERSNRGPGARVALAVTLIMVSAPTTLTRCNVTPVGTDTGGIGDAGPTTAPSDGDAGVDAANGAPAAVSVRGFAVINTDFGSTSVALIDLDGDVQSMSLISSASTSPGLSAALSGDVVLPSTSAEGDELILIDRRNAVLTWLDLASGNVRAQLNVGTGFASNPQDYVPFREDRAFVTRYEPNFASGAEPFDAGNDILIVDPSAPEVTGRIDLTPALEGEPDGFFPRATRAVMAGGLLRVLALGFDEIFSDRLNSRIVSVDPQTGEIVDVLVFEGLTSCGSLALSPDGNQLAVGCGGAFGQDPADGFPDAGIVTLRVDTDLDEQDRLPAIDLGGEMIGSISYASDTTLAFTTSGRFSDDGGQAAPDTARVYDLETDELSAPLVSTVQFPFSLTDLSCVTDAKVCLLVDRETNGGVLHHFQVDEDGRLGGRKQLQAQPTTGLAPFTLGLY